MKAPLVGTERKVAVEPGSIAGWFGVRSQTLLTVTV